VYVFVFWRYFVVTYVSKKARLGAEDQRRKRRLSRYYLAERMPIDSSTDYSNVTGLDRSLGLQEVEGPTISRRSAHEGGKAVSRKHPSPLPPENIPGTHFR
jgi:hypothetical protein